MVQSVGQLADTYALFPQGISGQVKAVSGSSSVSSATTAFRRPQTGDGQTTAPDEAGGDGFRLALRQGGRDFDNAFQHLSPDLQAVVVAAQGAAQGGAAGGGGATVSSITPAASNSVTDPPTTASGGAPPDVSAGGTNAATGRQHHQSGGNWALAGSANALINDMHGFVQVANGDVTQEDTGQQAAGEGGHPLEVPGAGQSGVPAEPQGVAGASPPVADQGLLTTSLGFAQTVVQAVQSYVSAAGPPQSGGLVTAIG
ncbi:MAG: hypothetical protein F8N37_00205 [Telmatospirillum sp.]|nr:hypothetical protein [Telmatospirillum sp.]